MSNNQNQENSQDINQSIKNIISNSYSSKNINLIILKHILEIKKKIKQIHEKNLSSQSMIPPPIPTASNPPSPPPAPPLPLAKSLQHAPAPSPLPPTASQQPTPVRNTNSAKQTTNNTIFALTSNNLSNAKKKLRKPKPKSKPITPQINETQPTAFFSELKQYLATRTRRNNSNSTNDKKKSLKRSSSTNK